jgi:hypothetical protein
VVSVSGQRQCRYGSDAKLLLSRPESISKPVHGCNSDTGILEGPPTRSKFEVSAESVPAAIRAETISGEFGTPATSALADELNSLKKDFKKVIRICRSLQAQVSQLQRAVGPNAAPRPGMDVTDQEVLRKLVEKFEIWPEYIITNAKGQKKWDASHPPKLANQLKAPAQLARPAYPAQGPT